MADGERGPDSRPAWLEERICLSLKCKAALFKKLMEAEGANRPLLEFLNNTDAAHVFLTEAVTGKELLCSDQPPAKPPKKTIYFIKLQKAALTNENMDEARSRAGPARSGAHRLSPAGTRPDGRWSSPAN
jgi:hypothetical protein